jgi:hypothetical protein
MLQFLNQPYDIARMVDLQQLVLSHMFDNVWNRHKPRVHASFGADESYLGEHGDVFNTPNKLNEYDGGTVFDVWLTDDTGRKINALYVNPLLELSFYFNWITDTVL